MMGGNRSKTQMIPMITFAERLRSCLDGSGDGGGAVVVDFFKTHLKSKEIFVKSYCKSDHCDHLCLFLLPPIIALIICIVKDVKNQRLSTETSALDTPFYGDLELAPNWTRLGPTINQEWTKMDQT